MNRSIFLVSTGSDPPFPGCVPGKNPPICAPRIMSIIILDNEFVKAFPAIFHVRRSAPEPQDQAVRSLPHHGFAQCTAYRFLPSYTACSCRSEMPSPRSDQQDGGMQTHSFIVDQTSASRASRAQSSGCGLLGQHPKAPLNAGKSAGCVSIARDEGGRYNPDQIISVHIQSTFRS